ncbi:hypothetical protein P7C73_g6822, partial [Tremellales sp. Uapishka_1]
MASAPIRQPRGPSSAAFGKSPSPPPPDSELRRNKTVPRHQPSASASSPSTVSSTLGTRLATGARGFRSGSLSTGSDAGLIRRVSGREVSVVPEGEAEEGATEAGHWGKGLSRQSSLPSRKGVPAAGLTVTPATTDASHAHPADP